MTPAKPVPTNLRILRGNPSKRPLPQNEPQPDIAPDPPPPPDYLAYYAREEWLDKAPQLHRLGLLTKIDLTALAAYCTAYQHWRLATEALEARRVAEASDHGLTLTLETKTITNPLVSVAYKASTEMLRFAAEFGFTPAARARIGAGPKKSKHGKFGDLLA